MELTEDDVLEILKLFEQSKFDFLQLEHGERKITVSKGGYVPTEIGGTRATSSSSSATAVATAAQAAASAPLPEAKSAPSSIPAGLVAVTAPMVGKFYSPSDPPYVEVGSKVAVGATVGLIEVMKVFASIKAETAGVVERILVSSGEFVEFGQPLFLLRPN
jgi:acetyl-CoA carboxylase biotin carboxyl carrier protein